MPINAILTALNEVGPQTSKELAAHFGIDTTTISKLATSMYDDDLLHIHRYVLSPEECVWHRCWGAGKGRDANKPTQAQQTAAQLMRDEQLVRLLQLNAGYMTLYRMALITGHPYGVLEEMAKALDLDFSIEAKQPRAHEICSAIEFIPAKSSISEWLGGTTIYMPSHTPGYLGVVRHFAGE